MQILAGALVGLAALGLAGCSDDEAAGPITTASTTEAVGSTEVESEAPAAVPVEEWAETFCDDYRQWLDELTVISGATEQTASSAEEAQVTLARLFGQASIFTTQLADRVEGGDVPDVAFGAEVVAALGDRFRVVAASAADAQSATEALDPAAGDFAAQAEAQAEGFRADVAALGDSFAEIDAQYGTPELGRALVDACGF